GTAEAHIPNKLSPEQIKAFSDQMERSRAETQSWLDRNSSGLWPAGTRAKFLTAQTSTPPSEPPQTTPQRVASAENPDADQAKPVDAEGKPRRRAVARSKKGS